MMTDRSAFHWNRLVDHINPGRWEVQQYIDAIGNKLGDRLPADTPLLAGKMLSRMVQQHSRVMNFAGVFVVISSEEHTSEPHALMSTSFAVLCLYNNNHRY